MQYTGRNTREISFPLGGIGSGSIGLGGDGRLIDWEIFNRPAKESINGYSHIAVKAKTKNDVITKILNTDVCKDFIGKERGRRASGFGFGPDSETMGGFPHFQSAVFNGEFPIAELCFSDSEFPANVKLTAFNPMIPNDDKNSSIPGAFFEIEFENNTQDEIVYEAAFSLCNPFKASENRAFIKDGMAMLTMLHSGVDSDDVTYGDLTIATDNPDTRSQAYWYRGMWQDACVTYWNDFNSAEPLRPRNYETPGERDTGTIAAEIKAAPGEIKRIRFVLTWNIPNNYNYWDECRDENGKHITWKNYYAVLFDDSAASAGYALKNWDSLYKRTKLFKDALFCSTLDEVVIDAVSANLSVLKSATVLRLEDGSFYGWEGVEENTGSCEGTCQHVWNYAYALCFLFPQLERSIRELEFKYSTLESGEMEFRLKLPLGREHKKFRACLDGQMGSVIKCYREWKLSGDNDWLRAQWQDIKRVLEYAWSEENIDEWDRDKDGVLEGRQHHTLDMELFGPSSWLEGMYLAALAAASEMADFLGDDEKCGEYRRLFEQGRQWTKDNLFNGRYFIQKTDIKDKGILEKYNAVEDYWNEEAKEIKYQIDNGSEIDQLLGQWHADILGLESIFDEEQVKTALKHMVKYNYKKSMRGFVNPWRLFSLNDEAGTVMCEYPEDVTKPKIPVPYCEETMTGFEYSFAGLLVSNGMIDEGIEVVKAVRSRYDGEKRNPWNEIECGSNYARSMASFALLPIFAGFTFDMPDNYIGFAPKADSDEFSYFWSLSGAWGNFIKKDSRIFLNIYEGSLALSTVGLSFVNNISEVKIDGNGCGFSFEDGILHFEKTNIFGSVEIVCE